MNTNDPNVQMLDVVAERLGDELCGRLVFVGGAVAGLLITDPAQPAIRPTEDVDLLAQVVARADYYTLEGELRARGFEQDLRMGAPICRWTVNGVTVDVMPTLPDVLGFSNRWYPVACETAWTATLPSGRRVQVITAPAFVATKLEAFAGQGRGDFLFSHDMADIVSVIDGRESLLVELEQAAPELRHYVKAATRGTTAGSPLDGPTSASTSAWNWTRVGAGARLIRPSRASSTASCPRAWNRGFSAAWTSSAPMCSSLSRPPVPRSMSPTPP